MPYCFVYLIFKRANAEFLGDVRVGSATKSEAAPWYGCQKSHRFSEISCAVGAKKPRLAVNNLRCSANS